MEEDKKETVSVSSQQTNNNRETVDTNGNIKLKVIDLIQRQEEKEEWRKQEERRRSPDNSVYEDCFIRREPGAIQNRSNSVVFTQFPLFSKG